MLGDPSLPKKHYKLEGTLLLHSRTVKTDGGGQK